MRVTITLRLEERPQGAGSQPSEEVALSLEETALSCDTRAQLWECGKSLGTPQLLPGKALAQDKTSQTSLPGLLASAVGRAGGSQQGRTRVWGVWTQRHSGEEGTVGLMPIRWRGYLTLQLLNET